MHYVYEYKSPIGDITMASDGTSLIGLWFNGQKYFASTLSSKYKYKLLPVFKETILWLNIYFNGKEPDFMPRIKLDGTAFRIEIWQILQPKLLVEQLDIIPFLLLFLVIAYWEVMAV